MSDSISRQVAIEALGARLDRTAKGEIGSFYNTIIQRDIECIEQLPTAQPERKIGKWIDNKGLYQCSACNHIWSELWWVESCPIDRMNKIMHYCPNCGAEMKGEQDG